MRRPGGTSLMAAAVFAFLYAPIVLVVINSFNADAQLIEWGGFTTRWYSQAAEDPAVRGALGVTLLVAAASTVISLMIALATGLWTRTASPRRRQLLDASTYMRIVLPEVVLAIGLFLLLRRLDVTLGVWTIVAGHVVFTSAYATIIIQARLASIPNTYVEAAADLGATPWRAFRRVTVPLLIPAILVATLLSVTLSFDDVIVSQFMGGTDAQTLPVLLLGKIRLRVTPEVNAIGTGVMLITLATFALAALIVALRPTGAGDLLGLKRKDSK